jgi:hypothetical protein
VLKMKYAPRYDVKEPSWNGEVFSCMMEIYDIIYQESNVHAESRCSSLASSSIE